MNILLLPRVPVDHQGPVARDNLEGQVDEVEAAVRKLQLQAIHSSCLILDYYIIDESKQYKWNPGKS